MAQIIKAPQKVEWSNKKSVFLAGSIDGGASVNWQITAENALKDLDILVFNPRRDDWDSSWKQSIEDPQFKEQVEWELDQLDSATHILMYFAPDGKSPITLLELGLHAVRDNIVLVCSKNFWRRGNVEIVAARYNIPLYENLEQGLEVLREKLLANNANVDDETE
ncbi:nucleoside 2-deoxyribosyltransferase domain-containing protein [Candidatus Uabimicrobium sp. HlEnr_7]|uniref:nucleoside 2-deoxyribosyltransferase domain-containing protein n=1 Tax=Candidatus Uabimicrobium helgolandensis TaxID=3095367 RepID=UPI0035563500